MNLAHNLWIERRLPDKKKQSDSRTPYHRDYGRIVHSAGFRRLQGKTQILGLGENDFYRTRLTHSIEVAQIGEGILAQLECDLANSVLSRWLPTPELVRAVCLIHDLGHPPFGHGGEIALNQQMIERGGFEGNGQSLRIVARLEPWYPGFGMNLTRRSLLGLLKYPISYSDANGGYLMSATSMASFTPPKCFLDDEQEIVDWLLDPLCVADQTLFRKMREPKAHAKPPHRKARFKSLDASIMDAADDISYGIHDMEDGIALGFIRAADFGEMLHTLRADLPQEHWLQNPIIESELFSNTHLRKKWISIFVGKLIASVELKEVAPFKEALLRYNAVPALEAKRVLKACQDLVYHKVIRNPNVCMADYKGQQIISKLFVALFDEGEKLMPEDFRDPSREIPPARLVCDYVASMTDNSAGKLYQKLFQPNSGSVFDML